MNYGDIKNQYNISELGNPTKLQIAQQLAGSFQNIINGTTTISQTFANGVNMNPVSTTPDYLKFTAQQNGTSISINHLTSASTVMTATSVFEYSTNNGTSWVDYGLITNHSGTVINLSSGQSVMFRNKASHIYGGLQATNVASGNNYVFAMTGKVRADGNIMSLVDKDVKCTNLSYYAFAWLFSGCTALTKCPDMPATTMGTHAYYYMYRGCTGLIDAPEIFPAKMVPQYAYEGTFYGCTNLENGPFINANFIMTTYSFRYMFFNCKKLKKLGMMVLNAPTVANTSGWLAGTTGTDATGRTIYLASGTTWNPAANASGIPSTFTKVYI